MRIGAVVVLREPVILTGSLLGATLLPKGSRGVVKAENGGLLSIAVYGVLYTDIPAASVAEDSEGGSI